MTFFKILFLILLINCSVSQAQEQTGHGKPFFGIFDRVGQQQQQQQQQRFPYQLKVITGNAAELQFSEFAKNGPVKDLEGQCSEPVLRVKQSTRSLGVQECFDRGEFFTRGTRYKCYVLARSPNFGFQRLLFWNTHNSCGGDGIFKIFP